MGLAESVRGIANALQTLIVEMAAVDRRARHARKGHLITLFQPVARIGVVAVFIEDALDAFTEVFTACLTIAASLFATTLVLARRRGVGPALPADYGIADRNADLRAVAVERILA